MRLSIAIFAAMLALSAPAWAVDPAEMLKDPAQEARAERIGGGLRCLVCQSESIEESNADLARDLRVIVRERVAAGRERRADRLLRRLALRRLRAAPAAVQGHDPGAVAGADGAAGSGLRRLAVILSPPHHRGRAGAAERR